MNLQEARATWASDAPQFEARGVSLPDVVSYIPDGWKRDFGLAMDALPTLSTSPNSAIPAFLSTMIDPDIFKIVFAPNKGADILGEERKGNWTMDTAMFPVVEHTGEVSSYGDFNENGHAGANTNWPQRQSYLFQTVEEYGDRELERAGLAKINWVSELDQAAATVLNKFTNLTYFFGVSGLQNYGLTNDPNLSAALTPATKAAGGTAWINSSGQIVATPNEVYADIQALYYQLVKQSGGTIEATDPLVLAMSPTSAVALTATNSFGVNVEDLLKKNFPKLRVVTAVQYGALSATNPQGIAAGNMLQMLAPSVEGQKTGHCSFSEKMKSFPIFRAMSSFKRKMMSGSWGAILRQPFAVAQTVGV